MKTKKLALAALNSLLANMEPEELKFIPATEANAKEAIAALEADISKPVEPNGWIIEGSLLYRLNDHGNNCDEINVSMADGMRTPEIRELAAAYLLKRITTPQEPALNLTGLHDAVMNALNDELAHGAYDCKRVWEAWNINTMSEGDFSPVSDRIEDIASHVVNEISAISKVTVTPQKPAAAAIPAGWQLVPIEPTREMCASAVKYANGDAVYKNVAAAVLEIEEGIYGEAYSAMLAAAPGGAA